MFFTPTFFLNLLFPSCCIKCGKPDNNWVCNRCLSTICREEDFKFTAMQTNQEIIHYDYFSYLFLYKGTIRNLIIKYKFFESPYMSNFFVNYILNNDFLYSNFKFYDIIIPVPMSKDKQMQRGYNQTALIAEGVSKSLKNKGFELEYENVLHKKEGINQQAKLNKEQRIENVKGAFFVDDFGIEYIKNKNIVLIDDIFTTGSTVNECSRILKQVGCGNILVLTLAKD